MNKKSFKNGYIRTDLACESGRISPDKYKSAVYSKEEKYGIVTEKLFVPDKEAEKETGKRIGNYTTVYSPALKLYYLKDENAKAVLTDEIKSMAENMLGKKITPSHKFLVAGLGNRFITPDSLGTRCADKIHATRHAKDSLPVLSSLGCCEVSVIQPGVMGQTGIESFEMIKGAVGKVCPDLVIVIDALAARSTSRLATTVQLSDCGIAPGGGIGNKRKAIDRKSVGCPVLAIGVPTIVDSSTLICDALENAGIYDIKPELKKILDNSRSFFVSLNDSDAIIEYLSDVISCSLNTVLGTSEL